jgi:hypothetical protein
MDALVDSTPVRMVVDHIARQAAGVGAASISGTAGRAVEQP